MDVKDIKKILESHTSPSFIFDINKLRKRTQDIKDILAPHAKLCYSIKANPFFIPEIIDIVDNLEVCSPGELSICEFYQVPPEKIIYSGVNKERWDVKEAADYGVGLFTAESLRHLKYINEEGIAQGRKLPVILRLNGGGTQFGMSREDLLGAVKSRESLEGAEIKGIHYFMGTQRKLKHQLKDFVKLQGLFEELEAIGFKPEKLEYGPGLKVPYFEGDDFSDTLAPAKELAAELGAISGLASLTVEMGRFIAFDCGSYTTMVMDLKSDGDDNYAILDGGMNHLNYYGQMMGMHKPVMQHIPSGNAPQTDKEWFLYGSLCSLNDIICKGVHFDGLAEEDILVFENCGAYSVTEGIYLFLSRRMPEIIFCKGGEAATVRRPFETSQLNRKDI